MAATRRLQPSPVPGPELARLQEDLPPYGSQRWGEGEAAVLIIRIPRDEVDLVNDLEAAVEHVAPADVAGVHTILLLGNTRPTVVGAHLLQDLMERRLDFDRRQCAALRAGIKPGQHRTYKAPDDPKHIPRLGIRLAKRTVADLDDADEAALVADIGPRAHDVYADIRVVYLVADKDEVRVPAGPFLDDLHTRWSEQEERRRLAAEVEAKEAAQRKARDAETQAVMAAAKRREITAVAPLRRAPVAQWEAPASPSAVSEPAATGVTDPARAEMYARLDAMRGIAPRAAPPSPIPPRSDLPRVVPNPPAVAPPVPRTPAAPAPAPPPPALDDLKARLEALKFTVLVKPAQAAVDLAAERGEGYPQRVIAFAPSRLDEAAAQVVLGKARELDADLAVVVCADVDAAARRIFIATKARIVAPHDVATLEL